MLMDEIKLFKWMINFQREAKKIGIEYDSLFVNKRLEDSYELQLSHSSGELAVVIQEDVPKEIKDLLLKILIDTKPEDSI